MADHTHDQTGAPQLDAVRLSGLLTYLESVVTIQQPKPAQLTARIKALPSGPGHDVERARLNGQCATIEAELVMARTCIDVLRVAGVTGASEAAGAQKTAVRASSDDLEASGERLRIDHEQGKHNPLDIRTYYGNCPLCRCHQSEIDDQYGCAMSPHGPESACMIRPLP